LLPSRARPSYHPLGGCMALNLFDLPPAPDSKPAKSPPPPRGPYGRSEREPDVHISYDRFGVTKSGVPRGNDP